MSSCEPGDVKPKCQDFQAPGVYCHWLKFCSRPCQSILHSYRGVTPHLCPSLFYKLATAKPWFSKDVSLLAIVVPTRSLYRKGIPSPVALSALGNTHLELRL